MKPESSYQEYLEPIEELHKYNAEQIKRKLGMSNDELDNIIRLIPYANERQTLIIEGQIEIHKKLKKFDDMI